VAGLMLTFRANLVQLQAATLGQVGDTTQETYEKILTWLRSHPAITRRELASRLGLSDSGIKYHLEKLKAAGVIRRVGATKSGYWEVLK
jgi:ATP-dependent DNA helicase RecG